MGKSGRQILIDVWGILFFLGVVWTVLDLFIVVRAVCRQWYELQVQMLQFTSLSSFDHRSECIDKYPSPLALTWWHHIFMRGINLTLKITTPFGYPSCERTWLSNIHTSNPRPHWSLKSSAERETISVLSSNITASTLLL